MEYADWPEQATLNGLCKLLDQPEATWTSTLQRDSVRLYSTRKTMCSLSSPQVLENPC